MIKWRDKTREGLAAQNQPSHGGTRKVLKKAHHPTQGPANPGMTNQKHALTARAVNLGDVYDCNPKTER